MAAHTKVTNLTDGRKIKRSQALGRIAQCLSVWVEENFSIRDLTLAEMIQARAEESRRLEALASSELPGIKVTGIVQDFALIRQANQFAANA